MICSVNIPELRGYIAKRGYSLRSFSKQSNISISYLSLIVNEKTIPSPKIAKRIADNLDVDIEELFTFKDKEKTTCSNS
ncbi:helix-turn-helix transcriptional regulator [Mammaliicoccus sciuri]|uniref:helix-turn-helix domain-containing protein n=1 Tax=Mammaliicoccus sciuri TaxID=1296 RepID=UPI001FB568D3|nr:helix-turn-helix transcriptional regulator [Mammaliicoccus sciuri]MCJ0908474.1 helix-turn-helix transcriptional regulator [Mammaliicoccus sciuri]